MNESIQAAIDRYDEMMALIGTCGDGNCVIKKPVGMHTNGGCRCWDDKYRAQRAMRHGRVLRDTIAKILAESERPAPEI